MGLLDKFTSSFFVTVQRPTSTPDGQGGHPITWSDHHEERVFIGNVSGKDVAMVHKKEGIVSLMCYADPAADIRIGDRLVMLDPSTSEPITYEVRNPKLGIPGEYSKSLVERYDPAED